MGFTPLDILPSCSPPKHIFFSRCYKSVLHWRTVLQCGRICVVWPLFSHPLETKSSHAVHLVTWRLSIAKQCSPTVRLLGIFYFLPVTLTVSTFSLYLLWENLYQTVYALKFPISRARIYSLNGLYGTFVCSSVI